ncbi:methyltransferase-like protein 25B isoform X2 [Prorops nasuta]|uniref:methyltransferase-like protein 25B isoform X2 n=1 Tax=Prorops nasuta TaxID=863751 RepID=UPI0034CE634F
MAPTGITGCACSTCNRVYATIDQIFRVLDVYGWLLDAYVVDFFQDELWAKLPKSWTNVLEDVSPEEFGVWLMGGKCNRVWPLSLLTLRRMANVLQICRDHLHPVSVRCCQGPIKKEENNNTDLNNLYDNFNKQFIKRVKQKKQHEIEKIAQVRVMLDIGAGMGHLARALAFKYGLFVTCVEQESVLSRQARKYDKELVNLMVKKVPEFYCKTPIHISAKLEAAREERREIITRLERAFVNNFLPDVNSFGFGLVGLHPCGDLTPTLLQIYTSERRARFICIIGCCYMKLTLEPMGDTGRGYPLSSYLSKKANCKLSYAALEAACHATEKHCDKLKNGNYNDLKVHAYRAALETILIKKSIKLRRTQLKNIKVKDCLSFEQYCTNATEDLSQELRPSARDYKSVEMMEYLESWKKVIIFSSIRLMLASLVETVVLLDRFLFLSERNLCPILKPIFDARISPRNFVLMSAKRTD